MREWKPLLLAVHVEDDMKSRNSRTRLVTTTMLAGVMTAVAPAAALLSPAVAVAQDYTSGILSGTVRDGSGAPVAGATVSVRSAQGSTRQTVTAADGSFRVPALAVGSYTVSIDSVRGGASDQVSVAPGGASYDFVIDSGDGADLGEVVVTARRIRDFNATDTGLSVDVQEHAERIPTGRSINAVTLFTPGASAPDATINASSRRDQSLVSLSGTSAAESVYYINGLNVTDQRNFLGYSELPFDFVQTIETKTGGYQAEFGRGTGGIVNIVTRSGTNDWTGGVSTFWSPDNLRSGVGTTWAAGGNNVAGVELDNSYARSDLTDTTVHLGGPLLRDRLFFYGAYNVRDSDVEGARTRSYSYNRVDGAITPSGSLSQTITSSDDPRWAAKFDFIINPDHRLEATFLNDEATSESRTRTFDATTGFLTGVTDPIYREAGGLTQIYKYTGVMTDWFTLSALYGRLENSYLDYGDPIGQPGIFDRAHPSGTPTWVTAGRQLGTFNLSGEDVRVTYRVDADLYANFFGEHHFRVGYDREDLTSSAESQLNGGAYYNIYASAPNELEVITFSNNGRFKAEQTAIYLQDSWKVMDGLNLQIGLRNDRYDYKNAAGESYISIDDQWAPRLGFSWDPFGAGVDRVYGSFGDYYLPIASNTSIRASSGEEFTYEYFDITRNPDGTVAVDAQGRPVRGPRTAIFYLSPPSVPDPAAIVERDLKPMFEREMILGYEHRFSDGVLADWSMGLRYIDRDLKSALEDTAIGDAVYRYCQRTSQMATCNPGGAPSADFASLFPYVIINPGDEAVVLTDLQGDARTLEDGSPNPAYDPVTITLTEADLALEKVERTYKALEFTFERPFDGRWGLGGSYTLAESKGNYEGAVKSDLGQTDTSITQDFDHSANGLGSYGLLPNHHRHTLKLFGNYAVNDRLNVGASFTAQSGRPYGCMGRVPLSVDPLAPQTGSPSGWYCPVGPNDSTVLTPRGSMGETDWTRQLDLDFSYRVLETERHGSLTASLSVFNVFDEDAVTRVVEQGFIRNDATSTLPTNYAARSPYYERPRNYQSPRSIRLGLRYSF